MEVRFTLPARDHLALYRYALDNPPPGSMPILRRPVLCFTVSLFLIAAAAVYFYRPGKVLPVIPELLIGWSVLTCFYLLRYRISAFSVRNRLRRSENAYLLRPLRVSISPQSLTCDTEIAVSANYWKGIVRIVKTREHAFFFFNETEAVVVPARDFANPWEFDDFVETADRYHREANSGISQGDK